MSSIQRASSLEGALFPAGHAGHFETRDFDEMAALPAQWKQEYRQVQKGAFFGQMTLAHSARMQVGTVHFGRGVAVDGLPPPDSCTFFLISNPPPRLRARGRPIQPTELVFLAPTDEIEAVSPDPFRVLSVSVDESWLQDHVAAVCGRPLGELVQASRCSVGTGAGLLASRWQGLLELASSRREVLTEPAQARSFEEAMLSALTHNLAAPATPLPSHRRAALARQARAFLHEHAREALRLSDLCRALGTPERTLHLIFMEAFGMSPKAYLKTLRLNGARRDLLQSGPADCVSGVAARWGFLHFGWFSVDYHRLFGERPSDTLARG